MDYKKETISSYNKNAKEFSDRYKKRMNTDSRTEFQKFIKLVKKGKILDLGCGPGYHSLYFKGNGFDVTSIDLSPTMIQLCKENGIDAELMDIEKLTYKNKSFDGIRAATSLLHIPKDNLKAVIQKLHNILKDNGILHVSVKEGTGENFVQDRNGDNKRFYAFWTEDELKNIFADNFTFIEIEKRKETDATFIKAFFRKNN